MSWRSRLGAWIAGTPKLERAASRPIDITPTMTANYFGLGLGSQPDKDVLLRELVGLPDALTRAIANRFSDLNPLVMRTTTTQAGTTKDEVIDDHPLKALIDKPHPNFSRRQLMRLTGQWIVSLGEAYWLKVGSGFGVPVELHPIPPSRVAPIVNHSVVEGYVILDGNGRQMEKAADEMVRLYWPDPESPFESRGYMGPQAIEVDTHKFASQHLRAHYQNDATPKAALEAQAEAEPFQNDAQKKAFLTAWKDAYHARAGSLQGLPAIVPYGYKLIEIAMQGGAELTPLLEYLRDDLFMGWGVPRSVLGQSEAGDRSTAETNAFVFDLHAIKPLAGMVADSLSQQLAADFEGDVHVGFEEFVARDKDFELRREAQDMDRGVRTINQVREDRQDDTVPWGNEPLVSGKLSPIAKLGQQPAPQPGQPPGQMAKSADVVDLDQLREVEERLERQLHIAVRQAFRGRRKSA